MDSVCFPGTHLETGGCQQRNPPILQLSEDVKTQSIEKTLLPLLSQINALVNARGGSQSQPTQPNAAGGTTKPGSTVAQQHAARVGLLVAAAADKFVHVGESLAEEYPDSALEMREACNDVQRSAFELRRLTDVNTATTVTSPSRQLSPGATANQPSDSIAVVSTARHLLSAITRVLLLADKLCVKQILLARDKVLYWLQELENVSCRPTAALAEFVATFSELGRALVELAHLSGDRQSDLRFEKDREALAVSRATLERGTQLLLAAAKTCLRHPESVAAAKVRDSILQMMRQALNRVGRTLNESIAAVSGKTDESNKNNASVNGAQQGSTSALVPQSDSDSSGATGDSGFVTNGKSDLSLSVRELVANVRSLVDGEAFAPGSGSAALRRLEGEINRLSDALQDFTDCAYTSHATRERLLGLLDRLRAETNQVAQLMASYDDGSGEHTAADNNVRAAVGRLFEMVTFLHSECQRTADQLATAALENRPVLPGTTGNMSRTAVSQSSPNVSAADCSSVDDYSTLINQLEFSALSGDQTAFRCSTAAFEQRADLAIESARLLRHIAPNDSLMLDAEHVLAWLRLISTALTASAQALFEQCPNPVSRVSRESFRSFANAWHDCTSRLLCGLAAKCGSGSSSAAAKLQPRVPQSPGGSGGFDASAGLFASPPSYSPSHTTRQASPAGANPTMSSNFCSAESLTASMTPPMNGNMYIPVSLASGSYRQGSLPRRGPSMMPLPSSGGRSPAATAVQPPPTGNSVVKRSGSQPSLFDHLRQLRRHADNLSAMDGAVAAFSTGNGPLHSMADLMLQAQFVAEQARTICRLSTTTARQLSVKHGLRDIVMSAVEKALTATGRLEAVLAMPPPVVPTVPYLSQSTAGMTLKNERVIASCHAAVVAAGNVVNTLLQSSVILSEAVNNSSSNNNNNNNNNNSTTNSINNNNNNSGGAGNIQPPLGANGRVFVGEFRRNNVNNSNNNLAGVELISEQARRAGRPWYSRSAANLAPTGAHPLSLGS